MDRSQAYEEFAQATVLAHGSAEEAAKRAILIARRPTKSRSEYLDKSREMLRAMEEYRRLDPNETDYWACADLLDGIADRVKAMPYDEADAEYQQYANSEPTRPSIYSEPERENMDELFADSKFS